MNKFSKFLTSVAIITGVTFIARKWASKSNSQLRNASAKSTTNNREGTVGKKMKEESNKHKSTTSSGQKTTEDSEDSSDINNHIPNYSTERTQKMYKDLGMTAEQRKRYEADYRALRNDWKKNSPENSINDKMKIDKHDAALNAVLNEAQYSMYRDWSKKNPH